MSQTIELGLDTFGDITDGPDGQPLHAAQVIRNLVEEAMLADEIGVDFIGVGEHHRADFAVSSPETVLAAIASRTKRIRLGSAVTVLSSDDPIRVFQRFSTLDAVSNGRAEVILGVPSNDFGGQEPGGVSEIEHTAHQGYGVTFPLAAKAEVRGPAQHPFYKWAAGEKPLELPRWNFHKYLVGRDGHVVGSFPAQVAPDDPKLIAAIDKELARAV